MHPSRLFSPSHQVFAAFAIYAFAMGNIFPRLGDVQLAMGVDKAALGLGLIGTPLGTLTSITLAAPLLERIGHRMVLVAGIPLIALFLAIAVHAPSPLVLFVLLYPVGFAIGCVEIIVNVEADRTENAVGYRIMNRCHAFWSIGFFAAGFFGAWVASLGISPQLHLALVVPLSLAGVLVTLANFVPAPKRSDEATEKAPRFALPSLAIILLFCVAASAMLLEGASMDWSAIYMRDSFAAGPFLAGIAVAAFAISQATSRFFADKFVEKYSPVSFARYLLLILLVGSLFTYFSISPIISLIGFALLGVGTSAIFPLAISAAAQRSDRPSAINVAALVQLAFTMFLLGPPLLGFVAEHWGIRSAYGVGIPLVILSLLTSGSLGKHALK
jgi:MFS family permease